MASFYYGDKSSCNRGRNYLWLSNNIMADYAVSFSQSANQYITIPGSTDFNFSGDFTLECFIKVDSTDSNSDTAIMGKCANPYRYMLRWGNGAEAAGSPSAYVDASQKIILD